MVIAENPLSETWRQHSLDQLQIADPYSEDCLDRIVKVTGIALQMPISAFFVIDHDRHLIKSSVGLCLDATTRAQEFCSHAILQKSILAVEDTVLDNLFNDNPQAAGSLGIRSYLGAPVRSPEGSSIGALCCMDTNPRSFSRDDRALILDIVRMIESELVIRSCNLRDIRTGSYSASYFNYLYERSWKRARSLNISCTLIYISADKYLSKLRAFGKAGTHNLLKIIMECVDSACRPFESFVSRLHDGRFAIFLTQLDEDSINTLIESIRTAIGKSRDLDNSRSVGDISVSVGYAHQNPGDYLDSSPSLLADRAENSLRTSRKGAQSLSNMHKVTKNPCQSFIHI